ncbi:MAG TPA: type II secretion system protein [Planctomycetota bacterium]|nr:type II secretion system protein [Planctomycetota bacterium]
MTPRASQPPSLTARRRGGARGGFSMIEMLIVMAIMTILAASLVVLVPGLRTNAMRNAALADIKNLDIAILQFREDKGFFPDAPYTPDPAPDPVTQDLCIDYVLYKYLTNPDHPVVGKGWGRAKDNWEFLRGDSKAMNQFLDPWGVPYYYIPSTSYLLGVRVYDATDSTPAKDGTMALPNCYGTTPAWDDFRTGDPKYPPESYSGPPQLLGKFYNSTTFQIHSKGPDQKTDYYSDLNPSAAQQAIIDACDRGQDPDDITSFGGGHVD